MSLSDMNPTCPNTKFAFFARLAATFHWTWVFVYLSRQRYGMTVGPASLMLVGLLEKEELINYFYLLHRHNRYMNLVEELMI
jgi:hypothetical protein